MLATGGTGDPLLYVAAVSMVCTVVLAVTALYPQIKDRKVREKREHDHADRLSAAADAVLGAPANPAIGRSEVVGLVHQVAQIRKAVGTIDGSGKSVMQIAHETSRSVENLGHGQQALSDEVARHIESDDSRFAELSRRIK